ncbi:MAG: ThiF family adenylyltransferase, partial [Bryobacteraceae bacterium]
RTACLKCVYPEPPTGAQPTCETSGVLNAVTSAVASWQVALAIRILAGEDQPPPRITMFDAWAMTTRQIDQPPRDPNCPTCARREFRHLEGRDRAPVSLCGRNAVQIHERARPLDLREMKTRLEALGPVRANEFAVRFWCPPYEMTVFADGRAIIKGTTDTGVARSLYARFIGA